MRKNIIISALVAFLSASVIAPIVIAPSAWADTASLFNKFSGEFRGSGTSVVGSTGKKRRISCQLTNSYDKDAKNPGSGKLKMTGKCASSQGASRVKGTISHSGNKVTGTYISLRSNVKMTKSRGKAGKRSLTILSSFVESGTGELIKIRQVLQLTKTGFQADFFTFDIKTKKYKSAGVISFKRK